MKEVWSPFSLHLLSYSSLLTRHLMSAALTDVAGFGVCYVLYRHWCGFCSIVNWASCGQKFSALAKGIEISQKALFALPLRSALLPLHKF